MYDCKDVVDVALFTGNLPYFIKPCLVKPFLSYYLGRFKIIKVSLKLTEIDWQNTITLLLAVVLNLSTTKLLSAKVKNSHVILRIVLPILTKFLQKSQIRRALFQEVAKQSPG